MSIQNLLFRDVNIFQILDGDGEPAGLVATTASMDEVDEVMDEWAAFSDEKDDVGVDSFADFLNSKGYPSERIFVEDEIQIDI